MNDDSLRKKSRFRMWALLLCLLGLAAYGAILFGSRISRSNRSVPSRPSLANWPAELAQKITDAEKRAQSPFHSVEGLTDLSRLYHANGFYNEAVQCYEGLRVLQPKDPHWPHLEASILSSFGRADDAVPLYRRAAVLDSKYIPTLIKLGDILLKANQSDPALQAYRQALTVEPGNPYALLGIARISIARSDWTKARDSLSDALRLHPDFARGIELMVTVEDHFGDTHSSNAWREKISSREFSDLPDPWLDSLVDDCYDAYRISVVADVLKSDNDTTAAIRLLDRAIELAPTAGSYHRQRGLILFDLKDYNSARMEAIEATNLSPEDPYSWTFLIKVFNTIGATDDAVHAISEALSRCPLSADLHILRARSLRDGGLLQEAADEFKEAHRLWPSEAGPLVELGNTYFAMDRAKDGLAALREAVERQPENTMVLLSLTVCEISLGDKNAAVTYWTQVKNKPKTPPQALAAIQDAFAKRFGQTLP